MKESTSPPRIQGCAQADPDCRTAIVEVLGEGVAILSPTRASYWPMKPRECRRRSRDAYFVIYFTSLSYAKSPCFTIRFYSTRSILLLFFLSRAAPEAKRTFQTGVEYHVRQETRQSPGRK